MTIQELELLLCGIPEIDVSEWKRHSRYLGDYRRMGESHLVIKVSSVFCSCCFRDHCSQ